VPVHVCRINASVTTSAIAYSTAASRLQHADRSDKSEDRLQPTVRNSCAFTDDAKLKQVLVMRTSGIQGLLVGLLPPKGMPSILCPLTSCRCYLGSCLQGGLDVSSDSPDGSVPDLQKLRLVWDSPRTYGSLLHKRQLQMLFPLEV
jgi:hypothetical protein